MADTTVFHKHRASDRGIPHRPLKRCLERGAARTANTRNEPLEDAEAGITGGAQVNALVVQIGDARNVEPRLVADEPHLRHPYRVPVECNLDRRRVAKAIIEQAQIEAIDDGLDHEFVDVGQLPRHADTAAGDSCRERRNARAERAHVRVERRVGNAERQFGVHVVRHLNAPRTRHRQTRRGRLELHGEHLADDVELTADLTDALVTHEEITHHDAYVVARSLERAAPPATKSSRPVSVGTAVERIMSIASTGIPRASRLNE